MANGTGKIGERFSALWPDRYTITNGRSNSFAAGITNRSGATTLTLKRHPFHEATDADLIAQTQLALQIRDKVSEANSAVIQMRDIKKEVADRLTKSSDAKLKSTGDTLTTKLSDVEDDVYQVKNQAGEDPLNFPIKTNNRLASLLRVIQSGDGRPIGAVQPIFNDLKAELKGETDRYQKILMVDLPAFNKEAQRLGLPPIVVNKPIVF